MYLIFAFRSRAQSMKFYNELKKSGISCSLINTPRDVSVGCGLSVKADETAYAATVRLLRTMSLNTFLGAFRVRPGNAGKPERLFF